MTTYTYGYQDDSSSSEKRGLLTKIAYSSPDTTNIPDPADVSLVYDNLGNRTWMTDGMGNTVYAYDTLSRMTSETRQFNDTLTDAPMTNNRFQINYTYSISGLKSYTDPYGKEIAYTRDTVGRISTITGSSFGGVTTYANNSGYRAWGSIKHLEYGNGYKMDKTFNDRLLPLHFTVDNPNDNLAALFDIDYEYYTDGSAKLVDNTSSTAERFDRLFTYDFLARVKDAKSGIEAHGQTQTTLSQLPYRQSYTFDAFGNSTSRTSTLWTNTSWNYSYSYANNRTNAFGSSYDNDGHQTAGDGILIEYDAAGAISKNSNNQDYETVLSRDGDGLEVKRSQRTMDPETDDWTPWESRYFIYSSVIGKVISEVDTTGKKRKTYVLADGVLIARQGIDEGTTTEVVGWDHREPSGHSSRTTMNGQSSGSEATESSELDAMGNNVGLLGLTIYSPPRNSLSRTTLIPFNEVGESWTEVDGLLMPGSMANPNALQASVLYQSDDGTLTRREYDFINDLPGVYRAPFPSSILGHSDGSRVSAEAAEAWAAGQARSGRSSSEFSGLISQNSMTFFDNPNCIKKVLRDKEGGEVEAERTHNLRAGPPMTKNEPPYGSNLNANAHDGIHIVASPGAYSVVALGAMAGKVLHYGPQNPPKGYMESVYGPMLSNLDIQLNVKINGDWLVLTLKDMRYESGAYTPGRKINAGTILGTVTTSKDYKNDMSESSGLHVTLMTLSTYNKYIKDKFSSTARASVPYTKLIDAELDPTSPFRCP